MCAYVCLSVWHCVCVWMWVWLCMCVRVCMCVYVGVCVSVGVCVCVCRKRETERETERQRERERRRLAYKMWRDYDFVRSLKINKHRYTWFTHTNKHTHTSSVLKKIILPWKFIPLVLAQMQYVYVILCMGELVSDEWVSGFVSDWVREWVS